MRAHPILAISAVMVVVLAGCGSGDTVAVTSGCGVGAPEPSEQTSRLFEISYSSDTAELRVRFSESGLGPAQVLLDVWDGVKWNPEHLILFGENARYEEASDDQGILQMGRQYVADTEYAVSGDGLDDGWYRVQMSPPREDPENAGANLETVILSVGCD